MKSAWRWIAVVLVVIVLIDVQLYNLAAEARREVIAQAESLLRRSSNTVLVRAEQLIDIYDRTLSGVGEAVALRDGFRGEEAELARLLTRRHQITAGLQWILVARENGDRAASTHDLPPSRRNFTDRWYFRVHLDSRENPLYVGPRLVGVATGVPFIPVSRRVEDEDKRFLGVAAAGIDPVSLTHLLVDQRLPAGYTLRLFLQSGDLLACLSESVDCYERDWSKTALFRSLLAAAPEGNFRSGEFLGDEPGAGAFASSARFPIVAVATVDERTVLAPWRHSGAEYVAIAVSSNLALWLIAVFAFSQTRRRREAMRALADANARLEERVATRTEELCVSEARARLFMNTATDAVIVFDDAGLIVEFNEAAERMFGYGAAEAGTMTLDALLPNYRALAGRGPADGDAAAPELTGRTKDGHEFFVEITVGRTADAVGLHVGIVRDISGRRAIERELHRLATRDALTGTLNRGAWTSRAKQLTTIARRYRRPLTLMVLDADRFKAINDTYGHPAGDAVLRAFAQVLERGVRAADVIGRLGGEEFGIVLPETDLPAACELGKRLLDSIRECRVQDGLVCLSFTVSIGATCFDPDRDDDLMTVYRRADRALYEAKQRGRDRIVCQRPEDA
ncbi:diguanylate cyclase [Aromatoleum sp.]|uniref:diguanylate cyclase n=1 Tax=Aromatoleum sp. TaxID=2307007 RepID=UPI002FC85E99